jgi:hypothetical protein
MLSSSVVDLDPKFIWLSWFRIRIGNCDFYENLQINLVFCLSKCFCRYVFGLLPSLSSTYICHGKINLFVTKKFYHDPDQHGSALVWLPGSGSALKPMRIHNTTFFYSLRLIDFILNCSTYEENNKRR